MIVSTCELLADRCYGADRGKCTAAECAERRAHVPQALAIRGYRLERRATRTVHVARGVHIVIDEGCAGGPKPAGASPPHIAHKASLTPISTGKGASPSEGERAAGLPFSGFI